MNNSKTKTDGILSEAALTMCDTRDGIARRLTSLDELNTVLDTRRKAGNEYGLRLQEWVLFGRFHLDNDGGVRELLNLPQPKAGSDDPLPSVLALDDFGGRIKDRHGPKASWDESALCGVGTAIPLGWTRCAICDRCWTIENFGDCELNMANVDLPVGEYTGKTLGAVRQIIGHRRDTRLTVHPEGHIRNNERIDLRPDPKRSDQPRNELGWIKVSDSYIIRPGDEVLVTRLDYTHAACRREHLAESVEARFRAAFVEAGFDPSTLTFTRIPNLRSQTEEWWNGPGFRVDTPFGELTIGWLKKAIEIHWGATDRDLAHLFRDIRTLSRGPHFIHTTNGYAEATDILARLREALTPAPN